MKGRALCCTEDLSIIRRIGKRLIGFGAGVGRSGAGIGIRTLADQLGRLRMRHAHTCEFESVFPECHTVLLKVLGGIFQALRTLSKYKRTTLRFGITAELDLGRFSEPPSALSPSPIFPTRS